MNLLRRWRSNRTLVYGMVATLALVVSAVLSFDFRPAEILGFLGMCVLMILAIILCAACAAALLLGARALWRKIGG